MPAYAWVPPGVPGYEQQKIEGAGMTQEERNELAKKYYAEAGYSADKPFKMEILYNTSENHKKIAVAIASMWKQTLGVDATLKNEEWKVYLDTPRAEAVRRRRARPGSATISIPATSWSSTPSSPVRRTIWATTTRRSTTICGRRK